MAETYWMSPPPKQCDLIGVMGVDHDSIAESGEFVDGKTRMGPWGCMCMKCHARYGVGLGLGRGQRYTKQADGRWLKTGG